LLAREMDADILVLGHLHRPLIERNNQPLICSESLQCPGCLCQPLRDRDIEEKVAGRIVPVGMRPAITCVMYIFIAKNSRKKYCWA
jgi:hypothetical protein